MIKNLKVFQNKQYYRIGMSIRIQVYKGGRLGVFSLVRCLFPSSIHRHVAASGCHNFNLGTLDIGCLRLFWWFSTSLTQHVGHIDIYAIKFFKLMGWDPYQVHIYICTKPIFSLNIWNCNNMYCTTCVYIEPRSQLITFESINIVKLEKPD